MAPRRAIEVSVEARELNVPVVAFQFQCGRQLQGTTATQRMALSQCSGVADDALSDVHERVAAPVKIQLVHNSRYLDRRESALVAATRERGPGLPVPQRTTPSTSW